MPGHGGCYLGEFAMRRIPAFAIAVLFICLFATSCADLTPVPTPVASGPLTRDDITLTSAIPAEYGDLIAVTTAEIYPNWAQLWFQKEDKTIVTVFLNYSRGVMEENALVIPRS